MGFLRVHGVWPVSGHEKAACGGGLVTRYRVPVCYHSGLYPNAFESIGGGPSWNSFWIPGLCEAIEPVRVVPQESMAQSWCLCSPGHLPRGLFEDSTV